MLRATSVLTIGCLSVLLLLVAVPLWMITTAAKRDTAKFSVPVYCLDCKSVGVARKKESGARGVEVLLWLLFIIPGVIYTLWRSGTARRACSVCDSTNVIPADSPRALEARG